MPALANHYIIKARKGKRLSNIVMVSVTVPELQLQNLVGAKCTFAATAGDIQFVATTFAPAKEWGGGERERERE